VADKPEEKARAEIDPLLNALGFSVQIFDAENPRAARGGALRPFRLKRGPHPVSFSLCADGKTVRVVATSEPWY